MRLIVNGEMIGGCMIGRLGVYRTVYFVYGSVRLVFSYFLFCVRCFCFQISPFSCFSSFFMQSVFFHGINRVLQIISGKKLRLKIGLSTSMKWKMVSPIAPANCINLSRRPGKKQTGQKLPGIRLSRYSKIKEIQSGEKFFAREKKHYNCVNDCTDGL